MNWTQANTMYRDKAYQDKYAQLLAQNQIGKNQGMLGDPDIDLQAENAARRDAIRWYMNRATMPQNAAENQLAAWEAQRSILNKGTDSFADPSLSAINNRNPQKRVQKPTILPTDIISSTDTVPVTPITPKNIKRVQRVIDQQISTPSYTLPPVDTFNLTDEQFNMLNSAPLEQRLKWYRENLAKQQNALNKQKQFQNLYYGSYLV